MVKITQQASDLITKAIISKPTSEFVLFNTGVFGVIQDGTFHTIYTFGHIKGETNDSKIVFKETHERLQEVNPKFKYKTHLTKYLYNLLNHQMLESNKDNLTGNAKIDEILQSEKYQKYLQNNRIEFDNAVVTPNKIHISGGATSYANKTKLPFYTQLDLLSLHERVRASVTGDDRANIKRPYKKKKFIEERYKDYHEDYKLYENDFNQLVQLWVWKLDGDGIREGYSNDDIYQKIMIPVDFRLQRLTYKHNIIRETNQLVRELEGYLENVNNESLTSYTVRL